MNKDTKKILQKVASYLILGLWFLLWQKILYTISVSIAKILACACLTAAFIVLVVWLISASIKKRQLNNRH